MNVRTNQLDRTRAAIIEAATEMVFGETDPRAITMQAVADAAGVSHRTLYRHFASRQELINAVGASLDEEFEESGAEDVLTSFDTWISSIPFVVAFGATHREQFRRGLLVGISSGEFRTDRDARYWSLFRKEYPHLDGVEARQDFVALRYLLSATHVISIGERFDLSPEELVPVIERSVATLLADIERRDDAARDGASS